MFRASELYHIPIYLACVAAGAGGTWYLTKAPSPALTQQDAAAVPHSVRTVSWFNAHQPEMNQKLATCNDNPGGAMTDPECQNALDAKSRIDTDSLATAVRK
jgi:hypothetical protein